MRPMIGVIRSVRAAKIMVRRAGQTRRPPVARAAVMAVLCLTTLAACAIREEQRVRFDGVYFRTKAKAVDKSDRQNFVVNVPKVERSVNGAREAGRFEATRYCIKNFGTSEILWSIGPDTTDGRLVVENNDFNFRGTCVLW